MKRRLDPPTEASAVATEHVLHCAAAGMTPADVLRSVGIRAAGSVSWNVVHARLAQIWREMTEEEKAA